MAKWISKDYLLECEEADISDVKQSLRKTIKQVRTALSEHGNQFPSPSSLGQFYEFGKNIEWTTGFWTGEIWLAYENSAEEAEKKIFREAGEEQIDSFAYRIAHKIDVAHHDMGFLYTLSCVAGYRLIGSETGKQAALKAADHLANRYQPIGEFIQAWGALGDKDNYRLIIDCLLNVPLLYWASEITGNGRYREIADKHTHTTISNIIRKDNSTWHTVFFDPETGVFDHGATSQGYKNSSAWSRGQAWGIYGSALAYGNTGNQDYMSSFIRTSDYFLSHLPDDLCPFWDLYFGNGDESEEPRDSSAAAIAICGFLEMSKYLNGKQKEFYLSAAKKILHSLIKYYQVADSFQSNGQLLHGTYAKQSPFNTVRNSGVDECVIWGDYFFMEALTRMVNPEWKKYW